MAEDAFDAIVVGAGPAGCACAYTLARAHRSVLLLERGDAPGAKNVSGGRLYTYALELVEPGLSLRAPLQRRIVREQLMLLGGPRATTLDFADYGEDVPLSHSVVRASLDAWFAGEVEAAGAMVASGVRVDDLLVEGGRIVGIRAGEDELRAEVVVAADGVHSLLGQKAGLFPDVAAANVGVGVKEVIDLPEAVINQRFNVRSGEGAARVAIGCTEGIAGGAFLYTNTDSISLGIVFNPEQAARNGRPIQDIFQDFKLHPAIQELLEGGTSVEYSAHLVPEKGFHGVPKQLYRDGFLVAGDAAQFGINTGLIIRGMDLAIVSGLAAAQAILQAPRHPGPVYRECLEEVLLPQLRAYANVHGIFEIGRLFRGYPEVANEALQFLFRVDGRTPQPMAGKMLQILRSHVSLGQLAADAWKGWRSL